MFDLQFIDLKHGKVLINPIGDNVFYLNAKLQNKINMAYLNMLIYGESYIELEE